MICKKIVGTPGQRMSFCQLAHEYYNGEFLNNAVKTPIDLLMPVWDVHMWLNYMHTMIVRVLILKKVCCVCSQQSLFHLFI